MPEISPDRGTIHSRVHALESIVAQCSRALEQQIAINQQYAQYVEELEAKLNKNRDRTCGMHLYFYPSKPIVMPWTVLFSLVLVPVMWYLTTVVPAPDFVSTTGAQAEVSRALATDYPSIFFAVIDQAYALVVAFLYAEDIVVDIPVVGPVATCMQDNRFFTVALMAGFFIGSWITALVLLIPGSDIRKDAAMTSSDYTLELPPGVREWVASVDTDKEEIADSTTEEGDFLARGLSFEDAEVDASISASLQRSPVTSAVVTAVPAHIAAVGSSTMSPRVTFTSQVLVAPAEVPYSDSETSTASTTSTSTSSPTQSSSSRIYGAGDVNNTQYSGGNGTAGTSGVGVVFTHVKQTSDTTVGAHGDGGEVEEEVYEVEEDGDPIEVAITALEELFEKKEYSVAINLCEEVMKLVGDSSRLCVYLTRAYYYSSKEAKMMKNTALHEVLVQNSVISGEKALSLAREDTGDTTALINSLKWAAIAHNEISSTKALQEKLKHAHILYSYLTEALTLTDKDAILLLMMGRYAMGVAKLSWMERTAAKVVFGSLPELTYQDALRFFTQVKELKPDWALNLLWLGKALVAVGEKKQARGYFEEVAARVVDRADDKETVEEAKKELAAL